MKLKITEELTIKDYYDLSMVRSQIFRQNFLKEVGTKVFLLLSQPLFLIILL